MTFALRYFMVVGVHPPGLWFAFVTLVAFAGWLLHLDPSGADTPLGCVLLLQMFSAATGFKGPALRGHYDALLVSGYSRGGLAVAHWCVSVIPGVAAWALIGSIELAHRSATLPFAFRPQSLAAILLVSSLSWAVALPLPQFSSGLAWTVMIFTVGASRAGIMYLQAANSGASLRTFGEAAAAMGAFLCCPFLFLGDSAAAGSPVVLLITTGTACVAVAAGAAYVSTREYSLALSA